MVTLLLACTTGSRILVPLDSGGDGVESVGAAPDRSPADTAEPEEDPDGEDAFFSHTTLHTLAIELSDASVEALRDDPYSWTEGAITVDGERYDRVGVRLRGKYGSFRDLSGKPKFGIDFNRYVEGQELYGNPGLNLNNEVVDCSYLKEPVGYAVYRAAGVPALRTTFGAVTVNGDDYGLYVVTSDVNRHLLGDWYNDKEGNLYDGKYWYDPDTGDYHLIDFTDEADDWFELESGVDVDHADVEAVTAANATEPTTWYAAVSEKVDWDEAARFMVAEHWIGQNDGYVLNRNNYFVYFDPTDGKADFIPFDLDYSFLNAADWGYSWRRPTGALAAGCWRDEACWAGIEAANDALIATVDVDALLADYDAMVETITDAADADPRRECPKRSVHSGQDDLRARIEAGNEDAASWGR